MNLFETVPPDDVSVIADDATKAGQTLILPVIFTTERQACVIDRLKIDGIRWDLPTMSVTPSEFRRTTGSFAELLNFYSRCIFGNGPNKPTVHNDITTPLGLVAHSAPSKAHPFGAVTLPHLVEFEDEVANCKFRGTRGISDTFGAVHWRLIHEAFRTLEKDAHREGPGSDSPEALAVFRHFMEQDQFFEPVLNDPTPAQIEQMASI